MTIADTITSFKSSLPKQVTLVAVSKTKPMEAIMEAYRSGHRVFGENKVQEMTAKWEVLPKDIQWHMIGHLQRNKVKYIAPYVHLIHAVDSIKLLQEIDKQAEKNNRVIQCLLQIKIAEEESKFGLSETDALELLESKELKSLSHVSIKGLMGMATFTDDHVQIAKEFQSLQQLFNRLKNDYGFEYLSMGMSGDFEIALKFGSNMIRVGSALFGERNYD